VRVQLDPHSWSTFTLDAHAALTDADGRFELRRVPRERAYLKIAGDGILPAEFARGAAGGIDEVAHGKPEELRIEVALRFHFQLECPPELADQLRALDADGQPLQLNAFEGTSSMSTDAMPVQDGRSRVIVVGEDARTLVLFKEQREVRRLPLALVRGELTPVRVQ
jgi:hypothetical protein